MSEKLTVAELLARSGRTSSDSGRRRHRRSLDEGGISVAELTGSIPVVKDTESEASTAPAPGADKRGWPTVHRAEAGANLADKAEKAKQAKAAEEAEAKKAEAEKAKQVEAEKAKKAKEAAARKVAEEKAAPAKNTGPSTEQTALITKVTADQAEDGSAKNASAMKVPTKGADRKSAEQKGSGGGTAAAAATAGAAGTAAATRGSDVEHKGGQSASEEFHSPEELEELQRTLGEDEVIEYEDDSISWPALIGQAIAAILVGIGVFLGFKLLWGSLPAVLVLVLALAVTLVLVGVVHALLRHRDKLIMILTFVVGLVLTIGPRLIMSI